jgi:hypothetical protein
MSPRHSTRKADISKTVNRTLYKKKALGAALIKQQKVTNLRPSMGVYN